jgi:hypothetical protein
LVVFLIEKHKWNQAEERQRVADACKGNGRQFGFQPDLDQHPGGCPKKGNQQGLQNGN